MEGTCVEQIEWRLHGLGCLNLTPSDKVTVLLVTDDAVVRLRLRRILEDDQDISIVAETEEGSNAVRMALELQPQVVITDCGLPREDGFRAAQKIAESCPRIAIVLLGMRPGRGWERREMEAGARAFVPRSATEFDLVPLIKRMAAGERILATLVRFTESSSRRIVRLSARELQVLRMIVEGNSTKEIAFQLGLSVNTVSVHRTRIARSLGVRSTAELVTCALRTGLAQLPSEGCKVVTRKGDPEPRKGRRLHR